MKHPWWKLYSRDYLTDARIRKLGFAQRGMLVELWNHAWEREGLPPDTAEIATIVQIPEQSFLQFWRDLAQFFVLDDCTGKLISLRMERERKIAMAHSFSAFEMKTSVQEPEPAPKPKETPHEIFVLWNDWAKAHGLPQAVEMNATRKHAIEVRMRDAGFIETFKKALSFMATSPYYQGKNDSGWKPTIDYLLKPGKAQMVSEMVSARSVSLRTSTDQHFKEQLHARKTEQNMQNVQEPVLYDFLG